MCTLWKNLLVFSSLTNLVCIARNGFGEGYNKVSSFTGLLDLQVHSPFGIQNSLPPSKLPSFCCNTDHEVQKIHALCTLRTCDFSAGRICFPTRGKASLLHLYVTPGLVLSGDSLCHKTPFHLECSPSLFNNRSLKSIH